MAQAGTFFPSSSINVVTGRDNAEGIDVGKRVEEKKLEKLLKQSATVVYKVSSVFPFTLFPVDIIVDEVKINILYRTFFGSGLVRSIEIKDVTSITVQAGLVFALLKIESRWFPNEPIEINYLKKSDAMKAQRIIQGLKIGTVAQIDYSKIDHQVLKKNVEEIGKTKGSL